MSGGFFTSAVSDDYQPPDIDTSVAHQARVYNYLLGGKDHFAADRAVGEQHPRGGLGSGIGIPDRACG
jgi:hypothetical protein